MEMEKTLAQEHEEALNHVFDVLLKNRNALCDAKGNLTKDNLKYEVSYRRLLNKVGSLVSQVATDLTLGIYFIPQNEKGDMAVNAIKNTYSAMLPSFMSVIKTGDYAQLESKMQEYQEKAFNAYIMVLCPDSEYAKAIA